MSHKRAKRERQQQGQERPKAGSSRALVAGPGILPSEAFREQVDLAVRSAMVNLGFTRHPQVILLYAEAGKLLLNSLVDEPGYFVQIGTALILTDPAGEGEGILFDPHAWILRIHRVDGAFIQFEAGEVGHERQVGAGERVEIIDFTARFYKSLPQAPGTVWKVSDPPRFLWGWQDELRPDPHFDASLQTPGYIFRSAPGNTGDRYYTSLDSAAAMRVAAVAATLYQERSRLA